MFQIESLYVRLYCVKDLTWAFLENSGEGLKTLFSLRIEVIFPADSDFFFAIRFSQNWVSSPIMQEATRSSVCAAVRNHSHIVLIFFSSMGSATPRSSFSSS